MSKASHRIFNECWTKINGQSSPKTIDNWVAIEAKTKSNPDKKRQQPRSKKYRIEKTQKS